MGKFPDLVVDFAFWLAFTTLLPTALSLVRSTLSKSMTAYKVYAKPRKAIMLLFPLKLCIANVKAMGPIGSREADPNIAATGDPQKNKM